MKCKVCENELLLNLDFHYIARDEEIERTGLLGIAGKSEKESKLYDAFDCPFCGCQNVMQERKRRYIQEYIIEDRECCPENCGTSCNKCEEDCIEDKL